MNKSITKSITMAAFGLLFTASLAHAQLGSANSPSTLNLTVAAEAAITVNTSPTLTSAGTFDPFTGATTFTYWIRTGGSGSPNINVKITSDFSCVATGPCVGTPPSGDSLTYSCSMTSPASGTVTNCAGTPTALTSAATSVATFGTNTHTAAAGATGNTVNWTLTNDPLYPVNSYSATATFTISAS